MITLDLKNKTIEIADKICSSELYSQAKEQYYKSEELLKLPFPFKIKKTSDQTEIFYLVNYWTFDSLASYENITDNMLLEKPEAPIAPSQHITYKDISLDKFFTLEALLAKIPRKSAHPRNVHVLSKGENIFLRVGGVWPNLDYEQEMNTFRREFNDFAKAFQQYEQIVNLPL